jgi:ABC-type Fe3+/spermidine/putrescine transport system ATPase subunit
LTTPDLQVDSLVKRFADYSAVAELSFSVERGSFFSILGPSGCGKTTLLRMIAGFITPDSGDIRIGGKSMQAVAPNRRPVNMVFQQLALFPMMSVGENVAFGLARRGMAKDASAQRAPPPCSSAWASAAPPTSVSMNSPADSASASRSRAVSCWSRRCCSSMSRSARSI